MCPYLLMHAALWLCSLADAAPLKTVPRMTIPRGEVPYDITPHPDRKPPKEPR